MKKVASKPGLGSPPPELCALLAEEIDRMWGKSWDDRKRRWVAAYPKVAKEIENIEDRALDVVQPPGPADEIEKWRKEFVGCVASLKSARSARFYSAKESRDLLKRAAEALEKALRALDQLPPGYVCAHRSPIGITREAVASAAKRARELEDSVIVGPSGGPQDRDHHVKVLAADYAFDLLNDHMRPATQSTDGDYFHLASILFEAATGREEVSIIRQCREHVARMREELGDPDAFQARRKRTGGS